MIIRGRPYAPAAIVAGAEERTVECNARVAIVEDDPRYRSSLRQLLAYAPGLEVVADFPNAVAALEDAAVARARGASSPWDIVCMDVDMPGLSGIEATRRLKQLFPGARVLVLTVFEQPETILEAICAGADGYLLKRARAPELLAAIRALLDGDGSLTPAVARRVIDLVRRVSARESAAGRPGSGAGAGTQAGAAPTRLDLTDRELDVLRALVDGASYKEVGARLGIGISTVRTHIASVYRKLQVHSATEAVARALRDRLV